MLIGIERLLRRTRHVPSRADELIVLGARLRAARAETPGAEERAAAHELRVRKAEVSRALADVRSCASCATGKGAIRGVFAGGDCCTGVTADLFSDDDVAALAQAGVRGLHLHAPRDAHAGCAFRGASGCSLAPAQRPERCVSYTCHVLRRELKGEGELAAVESAIAALQATMRRFRALRQARLDDEILAPLEDLASRPLG